MKEISKDKIIGIVGTVLFHALVLLLLYFLVMSKPPQEPEAGLAVVMGEEYNLTEVEIVKPEPEPSPQPKPEPVQQKPVAMGCGWSRYGFGQEEKHRVLGTTGRCAHQ